MVEGLEEYSCSERLRILGLTILEIEALRILTLRSFFRFWPRGKGW